MALVVKQRPDVHSLLCGQGVDRARRLVRETGGDRFEQSVHLLEPRADIEHVTAALDIAVSSSAYGESYPNAIAEAMACEVPVIVTDLPASVALVADFGRVTPVSDRVQLAGAILELLDDPSRRARLAAAGRERVVGEYGVDACVDRYREVYTATRSRAGRG
jgi:glycosyltransferase involved in cell wall biosynthesis